MPFSHVTQYAAQIAVGFNNPRNGAMLCGGPNDSRAISAEGRTREEILDIVARHGFTCDACRHIWVSLQTRPGWLKARHLERTKRKTHVPSQPTSAVNAGEPQQDHGSDDSGHELGDGDDEPDR